MRPESPHATAGPARLVFVCFANHCRSPMMELLLRAALDRAEAPPHLVATSAGTHAQTGLPAHPSVVRALAEHGVDATGFRATRLDLEAVEAADLVVTAAGEQRREVVARSPGAADRTFTLLDLAAWLAAAPAPTTSATTETSGGPALDLTTRLARGRDLLGDHPERDLPDPMGRGLRHFRLCRRRIEAALVPFLG